MRLGTAALTLAFGLGMAGLVHGEEESSGNWFSRMFVRESARPLPEPKIDVPPPAMSASKRLLQAQAALQRRQEVCLALSEIAVRLGDEELRQQVEQLDRRAWEAYEAATSGIRLPNRAITQLDRQSVTARDRTAKESR